MGTKNRTKKPVTLLTGYLGSGKTTVMNELLKAQNGKKIALIVNDMGSINIDAGLLKNSSVSKMNTTMIELQNGCICCSLRDEFMEQISELSKEEDIDAVLVEASGISNPASIAEAFLMYQDMHKRNNIYLNSIVTVVDADRIHTEFLSQIKEGVINEEDPDIINLVMDQIEFCNLILINKCDLLDGKQLDEVKAVIRQIQPEAEIVETVQGKVEADKIINQKRFDYEAVNNSSAIQKALLRESKASDDEDGEYGIRTFVFEEKRPFDYDLFMRFVEEEYPETLIRAKGYVWFADDDIHVQLFEQAGRNASIQEVSNWVASFSEEERQEVFTEYPEVLEDWDELYGDRLNQIVFIGKEYQESDIRRQLENCIASTDIDFIVGDAIK